MDIASTLMKEHSKAQTMKVVKYVGADKNRFKELMQIFFKNEYRLQQRSAWPVSYCAEYHPELVMPYLGKMIEVLTRNDVHPSLKRNVVRVLQMIDIPEKHMGKAADYCFRLLNSPAEPIAVKAFSITVLTNIALKHPDLKHELISAAEHELGLNPAPALNVRVRDMRKALLALEKGN